MMRAKCHQLGAKCHQCNFTANAGVLPAGVVVLGAELVGGIAEDEDAGTTALGAALLHDAGIVLIAQLASWSDNFNESFFLIAWSRSEHAERYSFLYLSASASSTLMSASVSFGLLSIAS